MVFCMVESKIPPIVYVFAFWVVKMLIYDFFFCKTPCSRKKHFLCSRLLISKREGYEERRNG